MARTTTGQLLTKRIADRLAAGDGTRVLIARYRPRGVAKSAETWAAWDKRVAPSVDLVDAFYGKRRVAGRVVARGRAPVAWSVYAKRFAAEMRAESAREAIAEYARRVRAGETITLLCHCEDASHCHRSLVARLIERLVAQAGSK